MKKDKQVVEKIGGQVLEDGSVILPMAGPYAIDVMNALLLAYSPKPKKRKKS